MAGSHVMALLDKFTGKETASYGSTDAWVCPCESCNHYERR